MSNFTQGFSRLEVTITAATTPKIYQVSVPTADTEVSQLLDSGTKQILIVAPRNAELRYAWTSGGTGSGSDTYITMPQNTSRLIDGINFSGTIYLRTNQNSQIVQLEQWT